MVKKLSALVVAGLLTIPAAATLAKAASVDELQKRVDTLEEKLADMEDNSENWDLASRIKFYGDFRFMANYVTADTASSYSALNVARGVNDFLDVGANGFTTTTLANFGLTTSSLIGDSSTPGTLLGNLTPALSGGLSGFITAATGAGLTTQQATDVYALFTDPEAGALVAGMGAQGATVADLLGALSSAQNLTGLMKSLSPAARKSIFGNMYNAYAPDAATTYKNDTLYTNRFRLNMRAKATENLEFKGRLAMYKIWGMQNNAVDYSYNNGMGGGPFMYSSMAFDGTSTRSPQDNVLRVDRAFINWNNIAGMPIWFSIGRRPVTDGPPSQLRLGADKKMATPTAYMNYPFDGASLGYAYSNLFGIQDLPGRVRLCYGRGFEAGPTDKNVAGLNDVDFGGLSWDVFKKGDSFLNFQSFGAFNMFNVPDNVTFVNPLEYTLWEKATKDSNLDASQYYDPLDSSKDLKLNRANLGNIYHTSAVYMSKIDDLHYFLVGGWSHTEAKGMDELGTSLLGSWWNDPTNKDGYAFYTGVRYDMGEAWRFGAEYNYGSKNWISFTPGHDEVYASKLAARGSVVELYTIWNIPAGEKISKFSKAFIRLGYQYYDYEYTGSGFWLGEPVKISDLANDPLNAQFNVPVDKMSRAYLSLEAWF